MRRLAPQPQTRTTLLPKSFRRSGRRWSGSACKPGAHILEPSMGVGHFFGMMPESLYPGTRRTGVELDSITARIAAKLYPDSSVHAKGFEDTPLPKDFFDAAIGNIPFGNYPVYDPAYRRSPHLTRSIHDYFSREVP